MSEELICGLCLGGCTEVPPFGTIHDAEDLIHPCPTCSLVTHRKCLRDWFNSLPASKLARSYPGVTTREIPVSLGLNETDNEDLDASPALNPNDFSEGFLQDLGNLGGTGIPEAQTLHILILPGSLGRWFSRIGADLRGDMTQDLAIEGPPTALSNHFGDSGGVTVLLSTPCPQCKTNITFKMKKSLLVTLNSVARNAMTDVVQYGGLFLGVTGAATGIVTVTCVGLARCGLSMLDCLIPSPLLMNLLSKKTAPPAFVLALFPVNFAGKKADDMLSWNMMDQFRLSHVPVLPIMMYRMRTSSISKCLFAALDANTIHDWFSELVICNYISSLGSHQLVRSLASNVRKIAVSFAQDPDFKLWGGSFSKELVRGIDFWDTNNMIAMLVPLRWAYDLAFRVTFNRAHFELATNTRPRDITNSLNEEDIGILEETQNELAQCHFRFKKHMKTAKETQTREEKERRQRPPPAFSVPVISSIYQFLKVKLRYFQACFCDGNLHMSYLQLKLRSWYYKTRACIKNDYSGNLLSNSITIRGVTTLIWPFLSADLGRLLYHFVISRAINTSDTVLKEKLLFLANIVGLLGVAVVKDCVNLYLSTRKARELSQLTIVAPEEQERANFALPPSYPGGYTE